MTQIRVIGVYPVTAGEPCHLIEIESSRALADGELAELTQPDSDLPKENWRAAYDGRCIEKSEPCRYLFFFHYLDLSKPLSSPAGALELPPQTRRPLRLAFVRYEPP
jgi:hypothetical protein